MWNRIWLALIAGAMLIWLAVMVDRLGAFYVVGFILLALLWRYFFPASDE